MDGWVSAYVANGWMDGKVVGGCVDMCLDRQMWGEGWVCGLVDRWVGRWWVGSLSSGSLHRSQHIAFAINQVQSTLACSFQLSELLPGRGSDEHPRKLPVPEPFSEAGGGVSSWSCTLHSSAPELP